MAKCGFRLCFHGSFREKADAVKKEARVKGAFIRGVFTRYGYRYLVATRKPARRKKR